MVVLVNIVEETLNRLTEHSTTRHILAIDWVLVCLGGWQPSVHPEADRVSLFGMAACYELEPSPVRQEALHLTTAFCCVNFTVWQRKRLSLLYVDVQQKVPLSEAILELIELLEGFVRAV